MIEPLDRSRRDSALFQFSTKQLRDFIDSSHLLIPSTSIWTSPNWLNSWKSAIAPTSVGLRSIQK